MKISFNFYSNILSVKPYTDKKGIIDCVSRNNMFIPVYAIKEAKVYRKESDPENKMFFYVLYNPLKEDYFRHFTSRRGYYSVKSFFEMILQMTYTATFVQITPAQSVKVTSNKGTIFVGSNLFSAFCLPNRIIKKLKKTDDIKELNYEDFVFIYDSELFKNFPLVLKNRFKPLFRDLEELKVNIISTSDVKKWTFNPMPMQDLLPKTTSLEERLNLLSRTKDFLHGTI